VNSVIPSTLRPPTDRLDVGCSPAARFWALSCQDIRRPSCDAADSKSWNSVWVVRIRTTYLLRTCQRIGHASASELPHCRSFITVRGRLYARLTRRNSRCDCCKARQRLPLAEQLHVVSSPYSYLRATALATRDGIRLSVRPFNTLRCHVETTERMIITITMSLIRDGQKPSKVIEKKNSE